MRRSLVAVWMVMLLGGSAVRAHHSYADYEDRTVSIEGTIEKIQFENPHVVLTIRTKDAGVYTATWAAAAQLTRRGVSRDSLKIGDVVAVSGNPSRVAADLSKISGVRRLSDGWVWQTDKARLGIAAR